MSDSRYSYDDNGEVWPYFAATLVGVVIIPMTGMALVGSGADEASSSSSNTGSKEVPSFSPPNHDLLVKFRKSKKSLFTTFNTIIVIGWLILAFLGYIIFQQRSSEPTKVIFDPYEILGVSYSSTERQIKSTFRKLSLKFHPDKIRDLGNQTREMIESRYVDITKAYKALTDDVVRENFLKYGHPDGPQQTSHGIALPTFLVEGKGSPFVIAIYTSLVGLLLPYLVGSWWSGTAVYTKVGIRQTTAGTFFEICAKDQPHFINYDRILDILSKSDELLLIGKENKGGQLSSAQIKQVIIDYLNRKVDNNDDKIDINVKLSIVNKTLVLLDGLLDIASAFKSTILCQRVIEVKRCIVQAVPFKDQAIGEYLQISSVDVDKKPSSDKWQSSLTPEQLEHAHQIPKLQFLNAYFKVPGESIIPPTAQAHLIVKFAVLPLVSSSKQSFPKREEFDPILLQDPAEEDETSKVLREPLSTNDLPPVIPYAHAPYFPGLYRPNWYGFIVNEKDNKIIDGPAELTKLSFQNLSLSDDELSSRKDNPIAVATFKIQLTTATPPFPGMFSFKLMLLSSGYFGCDIIESVKMKVENPPIITEVTPEEEEDDDISEPEEDSVAGALSQMRGGPVKKRKSHSAAAAAVSSSDKEDSSDEEEEEDLSDIDTDTEDEDDFSDEEEDSKKNK